MTIQKTRSKSESKVIQYSPLPEVIVRLNEIHRRLAHSQVWCDNERQRHLIEMAEHEVFRGVQLLEAEARRSAQSTVSEAARSPE